MTVARIEDDEAILSTRAVMLQLRPHIAADDYVAIVRRMMASERYELAAVIEAGTVVAVAGYRFMEMLYSGPILYVDDLVTDEHSRSRGAGKRLLDWLRDEGRARGCVELHLDSGVQRERAHGFYRREGLEAIGLHFRTRL